MHIWGSTDSYTPVCIWFPSAYSDFYLHNANYIKILFALFFWSAPLTSAKLLIRCIPKNDWATSSMCTSMPSCRLTIHVHKVPSDCTNPGLNWTSSFLTYDRVHCIYHSIQRLNHHYINPTRTILCSDYGPIGWCNTITTLQFNTSMQSLFSSTHF